MDAAGVACLLFGIWLRMLSASYHDSSHHAEPITAGPYGWVRHPLYLSNFLLGFGIVLIAGWWPMVVAYTLFFIPVHFLIARAEEVHLTNFYRGKYRAYLQSVPALLPWRPYRGPRYGSRSEYKLSKGRERIKIVGYAAGVLGILLIKELRLLFQFPQIHPLPRALWVACLVGILLGVILRPKIHSALLRASQTALVICCAIVLAVHMPGIWPARSESKPAAAPLHISREVVHHPVAEPTAPKPTPHS